MSNDALNWAWKSDLPPQPRFVLVALADKGSNHSGEDWACFPSFAMLRKMTGYSDDSLTRHLAWLQADGWITKARRRRADGSLGIYDFTLHQDRPSLGPAGSVKAAREAAKAAPDQGLAAAGDAADQSAECGVVEAAEPLCNMRATTPQNDPQPPRNLRTQEPLGEPLIKPTTGAREPGDARFDEGFAAYPDRGRKRTSLPEARAAWALACEAVSPSELIAAVARYAAEDADARTGDHGAPAFERWLARQRYLVWRVDSAAPAGSAVSAHAPPPPFDGPAEVVDAVAEVMGEADAGKWLRQARWDGDGRRLCARTGYAATQLQRAAGRLARIGVKISVGETA